MNTGRFDEAVTVLAAAAALPAAEKSPGLLSGIYYGLGAAKANLGDFAGARSALERSFAINPRNSDARRLLDRIGERR